MKKLADVVAGRAITHYMLPATGLDFMLTSQLSACTFGIGNQPPGGGVICSHLEGDPTTRAQRETLRDATYQFMPNGGRAYQKNSGWFENKHRYRGKAMVVGKRDANGQWKFFSQRDDGGMGVFILSKVHEI